VPAIASLITITEITSTEKRSYTPVKLVCQLHKPKKLPWSVANPPTIVKCIELLRHVRKSHKGFSEKVLVKQSGR
jgi:hypothetical protein